MSVGLLKTGTVCWCVAGEGLGKVKAFSGRWER